MGKKIRRNNNGSVSAVVVELKKNGVNTKTIREEINEDGFNILFVEFTYGKMLNPGGDCVQI